MRTIGGFALVIRQKENRMQSWTARLSKRLKSDVPVTSRIGWRPHQDLLTVRGLSVCVIEADLCVLNADAIVQYSVTGMLSPFHHGHPWRPFIQSMYVGERMMESPELMGDILLIPIVGVRSDKQYDAQPVRFQITVQSLLSSFQWHRNRYRVTCGGIVDYLEMTQLNKDGQPR